MQMYTQIKMLGNSMQKTELFQLQTEEAKLKIFYAEKQILLYLFGNKRMFLFPNSKNLDSSNKMFQYFWHCLGRKILY